MERTLLALGLALVAASVLLAWRKGAVIRHVTSKPLGTLAPGYAASEHGFLIYAALVGDLGLFLIAIHLQVPWLIVAAIGIFLIGSIAVILGEVVTYRALKRRA